MSGVKFGGFDQTIVRSNLKMQLALQGPWALGINLCRLHKAVEGGLQRIIIIIISNALALGAFYFSIIFASCFRMHVCLCNAPAK